MKEYEVIIRGSQFEFFTETVQADYWATDEGLLKFYKYRYDHSGENFLMVL